jgi:hypothetical protein
MRIAFTFAVVLLTAAIGAAQQPESATTSGRTFLLLVDDRHVDFANTPRTRALLKRLIGIMVDSDHIGITSTGRSSIAEPTGPDQQRAEAVIQKMVGGALRPPAWLAAAQTAGGRIEMWQAAQASLSAALQLLRSRDERRQAVLVYISNGHQRSTELWNGAAAGPTSPSQAFDALVDAANRGGVPIHTFYARGLMGSDEPLPGSDEWRAHMQQGRDTLRALAERTGGIAALDPADLETAITRLRDFARR